MGLCHKNRIDEIVFAIAAFADDADLF